MINFFKKIKKTQNKEKGITLVALVITILIIIILASVTINFVFGENGLINMAELARDGYVNDTEYEGEANANLVAYMNSYIAGLNGGSNPNESEEDVTPPTVTLIERDVAYNSISINVTAEDLESGLASENTYVYYLNGVEQVKSNSSIYTFSKLTAETSYTIKVEVYNGVGIKGEGSITIRTIAKPNYGAEVIGYTCETNAVSKWRIFYADESNIYLIADDYIASRNMPKSIAGNSLNVASTEYGVYFSNILNDYSGSNWISQNSLAKKWLDTYLNTYPTSTGGNLNAVAYLMDTNIWSMYAGETAEYAIGGPTLEMFCASYNDTHTPRLDCDSVTSSGYRIKFGNDTSYDYFVGPLTKDDYNSIYIKSDHSKANGMWIASSAGDTDDEYLFFTVANGTIDCYKVYNESNYGLRPVVCLRSNIKLQEQSDGTYTIVE